MDSAPESPAPLEPSLPPEPALSPETPLAPATPALSQAAPPIPPPAPYYCPNCGASLPAPVELCPLCGARITQRSAGAGNIIAAIALGLVAVPLGLSGSCFALVGVGTLTDRSGIGIGAGLITLAVFLIGAAALCIFGIVKVLKRK
ncbi:MAG: hypothetical protein JO316_15355 [Abitibacteriaceae bacterium]|nr:hypothetical protein [Abditibacteriaceae bacterium]